MSIKDILIFVMLTGIIFLGMVMGSFDQPRMKRYDCSLSEISPDYPVEVKEACRKHRAERSKE
jgi:hypothetical protein